MNQNVMNLRRIFLLILLTIGTILMLTACASDIPTTQNTDHTTTTTSETVAPTDTSRQEATELPTTEPSTTEAELDSSEPDTTQTPDDGVILVVNHDWIEAGRRLNEDFEYTLSDEDAEVIRDLFYNHEIIVLEDSLMYAHSLRFEIGEDYLRTCVSSIDTLDGMINGELVLVNLNDDECETIRQIVLKYHPDAT